MLHCVDPASVGTITFSALKLPQNTSPSHGTPFQLYSPIDDSPMASRPNPVAQMCNTMGMKRRLGTRLASRRPEQWHSHRCRQQGQRIQVRHPFDALIDAKLIPQWSQQERAGQRTEEHQTDPDGRSALRRRCIVEPKEPEEWSHATSTLAAHERRDGRRSCVARSTRLPPRAPWETARAPICLPR